MHPLHDYIVKQLAEKLKARKVVVWYDAAPRVCAIYRRGAGWRADQR